MANTGFETFDASIQKTNELLTQIEEEFGWQDRRNQSYALMRAVLHNLRDRLTVEKTLSLADQFPLLIKGIMIDGWNINKVPVKMDKQQFLNKIREDFQFSTEEDIEDVVDKTLNIIMNNVAESERENIKDILPQDLAGLI